MSLIQYLYIIPSLILLSFFGRIFTKGNFSSNLLSGLLVSSSIIAVTSRYIPVYNVPIIILLIAIGLIYYIYEILNNNNSHKNIVKKLFVVSRKKAISVCIIFLGLIVYFIDFHYRFLSFESHSVLYFGPSFEILKADYIGNLRVPTHYPSEFSAMHIIPSAAVSIVGFLNPHPSLAFFTEIRYILCIIFYANFVYSLHKILQPKAWKLLFVLLIIFGVYGNEIFFNLYVSSFIYVFVLFEIFIRTLKTNLNEQNKESQNHKLQILFFSILLIICKAPIFYIAGAFAFYIWWNNRGIRFAPLIVFALILVLINMFSWYDISKLSTWAIAKQSNFSLNLGFEFSDVIGWSLNDSVKQIINWADFSIYTSSFAILVYIFIKYYSVFLIVTLKGKKLKNLSFFNKSLLVYCIISLIGIVLIRNNEKISLQAHAYFLMSTLSMCGLIVFLLKSELNKYKIVVLSCIFLFYCFNKNNFGLVLDADINNGRVNNKFLKYDEANIQDFSQSSYKIHNSEPYWKSELNAQLSGLRINAYDVDYLDYGQTRHWIIGGEKKLLFCEYMNDICIDKTKLSEDQINKCKHCFSNSIKD